MALLHKNEGEGGHQRDRGGQDHEGPPFDLGDEKEGEEVGSEVGGVDDDAVEVEVEADLVDEHLGNVVDDVGGEAKDHGDDGGGPEGGVPEEVEEGETHIVLTADLFIVLLLESCNLIVTYPFALLKLLLSAVDPGDEPQILSNFLDFQTLHQEERSVYYVKAAEEESKDDGQEAEEEEYEFPFPEVLEGEDQNYRSQRDPGLDEGLHLLSLVVLQHLSQEAKHQIKTALSTKPHQKMPHSSHRQIHRHQHHHVPNCPHSQAHHDTQPTTHVVSHQTHNHKPSDRSQKVSALRLLHCISSIAVIVSKLSPNGVELFDLFLLVLLSLVGREGAGVLGTEGNACMGRWTFGVGRYSKVVGAAERYDAVGYAQYNGEDDEQCLIATSGAYGLYEFEVLIFRIGFVVWELLHGPLW